MKESMELAKEYLRNHVGFQVLTAGVVNMVVFWLSHQLI
jgi:hypothetical protein